MPAATIQIETAAATTVQPRWAATPIPARLRVLRRARHLLAESSAELALTLDHLPRTPADSLAAEILPLLEACRFLERRAARILRPLALGRRGLPFWLGGVSSTVERVPHGTVLILAPANYPLFLPGVQCLQALAAGNAVIWKPGRGGRRTARLFADIFAYAGLPPGLLTITDESIEAAAEALALPPGKIVFTGSASVGREVLHAAADTLTPVVAELSGCDAVLALPSADPALLTAALTFGMRLNASQTCMAPRRLILIGPGHQPLLQALKQSFSTVPPAPPSSQLQALLLEAHRQGAEIHGEPGRPVLVLNPPPGSPLTQTDLFTPVLTVLQVETAAEAVALHNSSSLSLSAAVFGEQREALALASGLRTGTLLINDLIVPTADPRLTFPARGASGFGTTRGAEGLLEMTLPRALAIRRRNNGRHFQATTSAHEPFFAAVIAMSHSAHWRQRLLGLQSMIKAARNLTR